MTAPTQADNYVGVGEHGVLRVAKSGVALDSVVIAFGRGDSPDAIQQQYPSLTLEQVYGAINYYLVHRDEVDAYLQEQRRIWDRKRAKGDANPSEVVKRLRRIKAERAQTAQIS